MTIADQVSPRQSAEDDGLEFIGTIVRLQVQTESLKQGQKPHRWYEPSFIRAVPQLRLDEGGVTGIDGEPIADVHHRDHPASKFRGENGASVGFTGHYRLMRDRFGDHLTDGISGENILVDVDRLLQVSDVAQGIAIRTSGGLVRLSGVESAPPCVEFTKFCAGYAPEQRSDRVVTEALQFLSNGMRGFYATLAPVGQETVTVALGGEVYLVRS